MPKHRPQKSFSPSRPESHRSGSVPGTGGAVIGPAYRGSS